MLLTDGKNDVRTSIGMRTPSSRPLLWATLLLAMSSVSCAQETESPGSQDYDPHDFTGVWNEAGGGRYASEDQQTQINRAVRPHSAWSDEELPFTEEGWAAYLANSPTGGPRQVQSRVGKNDPRDQGNPLGLYRNILFVGTARYFEIIQTENKIVQLFGVDRAWRNIYTDGRPVPDYHPAGPFWYGHSVGHWEGDTLVVMTVSLDERAWLDGWGTPFSMDARIEERWQRIGPDDLRMTITIHDPTFYSRPWTSLPVVFSRVEGVEPFEMISAPIDIDLYNEAILAPSAVQDAE